MKPLEDRVVIKPTKPEEKSKGGIIIPTVAQEKTQEGVVLLVGPGKMHKGELVAMTLEVDDKVLYAKYAGTEIEYKGDEVLILRENEVLAKL